MAISVIIYGVLGTECQNSSELDLTDRYRTLALCIAGLLRAKDRRYTIEAAIITYHHVNAAGDHGDHGDSISAAEDSVCTASKFGVTADTARLIAVQAVATGVAKTESKVFEVFKWTIL